MEFMEQIKQTATEVAQTVAQKSTELVGISKIKYEIHDLNADLKRLYGEIGRTVYQELRTSPALTEDIQIKCEIIEAKLARIEALKAKEKAAKHGLVCPACGHECQEDANFCPRCGAELAVEVKAETGRTQVRQEQAEPAETPETAEPAEPAEVPEDEA